MEIKITQKYREYSADMLAVVIQHPEERLELFNELSSDFFYNEEHLLYRILEKRKDSTGVINEDYITIVLTRNLGMIYNSDNIDLNRYSSENLVEEITLSVMALYNNLKNKPLKYDDLTVTKELFLNEYALLVQEDIYKKGQQILESGLVVKGKLLQGLDDAVKYQMEQEIKLEKALGYSTGKSLKTYEDLVKDREEIQSVRVSDISNIKTLNDIFQGIRTSLFYVILGTGKTGKSKLALRIAKDATEKYKQNVIIWPLENGASHVLHEWEAMHYVSFLQAQNKNNDPDAYLRHPSLYATDIEYDKFSSPQQKQIYEMATQDLMENENLGKLHVIDEPMYLETFEDIIRQHVHKTKATVVVVDYLGLIDSMRGLGEAERIALAYRRMNILAKELGIAVITPAQFKQDYTIDKSKGEDFDIRVAAGGSKEVFLTPDIIIPLYASQRDLAESVIRLQPAPSRKGSIPNEEVINVDYSFNWFTTEGVGI